MTMTTLKLFVLAALSSLWCSMGFVMVSPSARGVALKVDYASMTAEALEEELRASHRKLFEMKLERQQSKKKEFKSHEVRALKKKIAQIMPVFESKIMPAEEEEEKEEATA